MFAAQASPRSPAVHVKQIFAIIVCVNGSFSNYLGNKYIRHSKYINKTIVCFQLLSFILSFHIFTVFFNYNLSLFVCNLFFLLFLYLELYKIFLLISSKPIGSYHFFLFLFMKDVRDLLQQLCSLVFLLVVLLDRVYFILFKIVLHKKFFILHLFQFLFLCLNKLTHFNYQYS